MRNFDHVVIAGSGPVGSFMAVLCASLGFYVTVYEKRRHPSRNINLKIQSGFFYEVLQVLSQLKVKNEFFVELNNYLDSKNNRITIKELEERFITEAKSLGANYITKEVRGFRELYREHKDSNPIILDCAGRKSKLRINEFGDDQDNMVIIPLQHAMYINFKAKVNDNLSLYQVMKYVKDIKLAEIVVSKEKNSSGFKDVTIPVFITDELANTFDRECPNTNKEPFNPFNNINRVSERIFFVLSSLFGNLIIDGWSVNLDSIRVKKIDINCGYAKRRSYDCYISMGDSAVHLAFFKSLNLGLRHALDLFIKLSMFHRRSDLQDYDVDSIITLFKQDNPHLNPIAAYPTEMRNIFLVVTKVIRYGCFSYCLTNHKTERLTNYLGVTTDRVSHILQDLNNKLNMWKYSLEEFEAKRDEDIRNEMKNNEVKNVLYNYLSWFVDLNGKSIIKMSELKRAVEGKYALHQKDFDFLFRCFKSIRNSRNTYSSTDNNSIFLNTVSDLLKQCKQEMSFTIYQLKKICCKDLSDEEKVKLISSTVQDKIRHTKLKEKSSTDNIDVSSNFILNFIRNELYQMQEPNKTTEELGMLLPELTLDETDIEPVAGPSWKR